MPEEGDDLEEFAESDEYQGCDDGVGGVAQASCTVHKSSVATVLIFFPWL